MKIRGLMLWALAITGLTVLPSLAIAQSSGRFQRLLQCGGRTGTEHDRPAPGSGLHPSDRENNAT
jgi:hypothetical protein